MQILAVYIMCLCDLDFDLFTLKSCQVMPHGWSTSVLWTGYDWPF